MKSISVELYSTVRYMLQPNPILLRWYNDLWSKGRFPEHAFGSFGSTWSWYIHPDNQKTFTTSTSTFQAGIHLAVRGVGWCGCFSWADSRVKEWRWGHRRLRPPTPKRPNHRTLPERNGPGWLVGSRVSGQIRNFRFATSMGFSMGIITCGSFSAKRWAEMVVRFGEEACWNQGNLQEHYIALRKPESLLWNR